MNSKERVIAALERKQPDRIPVFEWIIAKNVIQEIIGSDDLLSLVETLDLDGINYRADYKKKFINEKIYFDEWGSKKQLSPDGLDTIIEHPLQDLSKHKRFHFPDPYASGRFESIEKAVERFGNSRAIVLTVRDVFSDIRDLIGFENTLVALLKQQDLYSELLDRLIEYNLTLAEIANKKYGIEIIATSDDYATAQSLIFSPELFKDFLGPAYRKLVREFKRIGFHYIKHTDGNIMDIIEYLVESGIDCLDPIDPNAGMNIADVKKKYGKKICIKGNIDNTSTLSNGTKEQVEKEVRMRISQAGQGGGYILSSSNTIHSGVKPENFIHMVETVKKYGKYPLEE